MKPSRSSELTKYIASRNDTSQKMNQASEKKKTLVGIQFFQLHTHNTKWEISSYKT
jgi:hypothetical protein